MKFKDMTSSAFFYTSKRDRGFILLEVLIASTILAIVVLVLYAFFARSMSYFADSKNETKALMIAKSLMNEFRYNKMREADIADSHVDNFPDFTYDRITTRYEDDFITPMIEPLIINKTTVKVKWKYKDKDASLELSMIYQAK